MQMSEQQNALAQKWIKTIDAYGREFKTWETRAGRIVKIYRDYDSQNDNRNGGQTKFNILWSNVQTCLPATFARLPKPDVSRRFRDNDPVGRVAALILERALEFEIDHYPDYRAAMENSVLDRFLGGRGVSWIRYEPHFKAAEEGLPEDGVQITEDADEAEDTPEAQEVIDYECAPVDYVHWREFGHTVARTWEEVTAVWRLVYLSRPALVERFGEELGNEIPLDTRPEEQKKYLADSNDNYQAAIYEIWDKGTNKALWLSKSMGKILDERDDPLGLEGFFPCPRPLYATTTTDSLIPVPDYKLYQDQANELNILSDRIDGLIKALKVRGVRDASQPELARLFTEGENNTLIPVDNWQSFAEKNGLKGVVDLMDITPIAQALNEAYKSEAQIKNTIYEIMGIADIMRGSSDPRETAEAIRTKGQFGGMRLRSMQSKVGQFATEILQIKAQVMCKFFAPETLFQISAANQLADVDQEHVPAALQMLKDQPLRNFRIEVSADSMVQMDEQQEKQDRMQFLQATGAFLKEAVPVATQNPQLAPLLVEMMKFGVTGFRVGKTIEGQFDETLDKLKQVAANPPPKPPSPEEMKLQGESQKIQMQAMLDEKSKMQDLQIEQQRMAMEAKFEEQRQRNEMAVEQSKQAAQAQQNAHQNELESQREQMRAQNEAALEAMRIQSEKQTAFIEDSLNRWKAQLDAATKIEVANIAAEAKTVDAATETSTNEIASEVKQ